jgi:hypothetical protein
MPLQVFSQYIGIKLPSSKTIDVYYYEIVDFDGNLIIRLDENVIPFFSSYLNKRCGLEGIQWAPEITERQLLNDESFFIVDPSQKVLALSTPDSTYLIDFKGSVVKSFGEKYTFISQSKEEVIIAYRPVENNENSFMLVYLNEKGDEIFPNKEYWEATPFNDGLAIVQEQNDKGDWKIINRSGEDVLNLTKLIKEPINEAHEFVNGYANISTSYSEYRINREGEINELSKNAFILDEIYHRGYFKGKDFQKIISKKNTNKSNIVIDSIVASKDKFYLIKDQNNKNKIVSSLGKISNFPKRYNPIKCIKDQVLGKRNNKYVLYNPENESGVYFEDKTPIHFMDLLINSIESHEEFVIEHGRLVKIGPNGVSSLLTLDGELIYDFDASEMDNSIPLEMKELSRVYHCPDKLDYEEINNISKEYIHIQCEKVDLKEIDIKDNLKMILIQEVKTITNSNLLIDLLNNGVVIGITGSIESVDLKLDTSKVFSGSLTINEQEIINKKNNKK